MSKKFIAKSARALSYSFVVASTLLLGSWWRAGAKNYKTLFLNEKPNINQSLPKEELESYKEKIKDAYKPFTFVRTYSGKEPVTFENFTEREITFISEQINSCKVIQFADLSSGFKAVALQDTTNKKITVAIRGGDTNPFPALQKDFFDSFHSSAGSLTEQFPDLISFVDNIERNFKKPSKFIGHSLGAHLITCISPKYPNAEYYAFDGPGASFSLIDNLSKHYNLPKKEIENSLAKVVRVKVKNNIYNTIGSAGIDITLTDPKKDDYSPFAFKEAVLREHFHTDWNGKNGFLNAIDNNNMQTHNSSAPYSSAPVGSTSIILILNALSLLASKKLGERLTKPKEAKETNLMQTKA